MIADRADIKTRFQPRHGMRRTPTYKSWLAMKQRCLSASSPQWLQYGAKGVTVCERWLSFEGFFADMGVRPPGTSLDRIDNAGNYEPGNCRWATRVEQARNMTTNRIIEAGGESLTLQEWADRLGVDHSTIRRRIQRGWSAEDAVTEPPIKPHSNAQIRAYLGGG